MEDFAQKEKLEDYQNRVAEWIGSQGILFQLRYARTVGMNSILKQLGGICAKLVILLAIFAAAGYFLVGKHFQGDSYEAKMSEQLQESLGAADLESKGFARSRGNGGYHRLELEGGEKSFFYRSKMKGVNAPLTYLTGVTQDWKPDSVKIDEIEMSVKAGGTRDEMLLAYRSVLESFKGHGLESIIIADFTCDWGYSKLTYGRIDNAYMKAVLEDGQWIVSLTGGTYQQNWLRDFELVTGDLVIAPSGVEVRSLKLRNGPGDLEITGNVGGPLERPEFALNGQFTNLALEKFVQVAEVKDIRKFLQGHISGDLSLTGSTNRMIKIAGKATVAENRAITIRENWKILKGLSILDTMRTFRRVDFREGGFTFESEGGGLIVKDLDLKAKDTFLLRGEISTRLPTQMEAAEALNIKLTDDFSSDYTDTSASQKLEDDRMSLSSAVTKGMRIDDLNLGHSGGAGPAGVSEDERLHLNTEQLKGARLRDEMKSPRISGELEMAIPASTFAEYAKLKTLYPEDGEGWRWLTLPLSDNKFMDIGAETNRKILSEARTRGSGLLE